MKHLKMSICLLFTVALFTSCEKETTTLPENPEMNVKDIKSVGDAILAGVDIQSYLNSLQKQENTANRPSLSQLPENSGLNFYFNAEDMPCGDLPTESFDGANYENGYATYYDGYILDENTNSDMFSPGDILPGISFESVSQSWGLYLWSDSGNNVDKALFENNYEDLIINYTNNNVTSVSMNVKSWYWGVNIYMDVYGDSGYLGTSSVYLNNGYEGEYWGVTSSEPITKIVLHNEWGGGYVGVDNISFGNCNDLDGDGVLNENDVHPNSDLSEKINIGDCYPNVDNKMVKNGSTMMDQINDLIAEINSQYNGENYDYLHKRFMTKLAGITYNWKMARLITATQRTKISSCGWSANVPYSEIN